MRYSTLIVVLGVMTLSVAVFATNADGAGLVWRAVNKAGSSLFDIADVGFTSCSNGQVLKYQTSNSTWVCSSGYTKVNNLDTSGTASILATNATLSGTQATFKTLTQGSGISITNGTKTVTIASSITQGYTKINNVDTTGGTASILATNATLSSTQATFKTITAGTAMTLSNGTKTVTINNNGVTSLTGTANNVTVSASTGAVTLNTGSNVVITGGSAQIITKSLNASNTFSAQGLSLERNLQKNTAYTATSTDDTIIMNLDGGTSTRILTLPTASSSTGKIFTIKRIGDVSTEGIVAMIDGNGADTIDGFANFNLTNANDVAIIQSNGTEWKRLDVYNSVPVMKSTTRFISAAVNQAASGTIISTAATIRAHPWIITNTVYVDQIAVEVATAANPTTNTCRIGIYRDNGNAYPGRLVTGTDVATIDNTAAVKTNTMTSVIQLDRGLYWAVYACQTAATTQPTFRGIPVAAVPNVLGYDGVTTGANQAGTGYTVAFTFGALPANYPAGATVLENTIVPNIMLRAVG